MIGVLKGNAREWFGSLTPMECDKGDFSSIERAIQLRYGKTLMQKIRAFEAIKQKSTETYSQYTDRLRKACYGISKTTEELTYKFFTTISNSSAVYDDVINLPCDSLQKAVEYVEQHSKSKTATTHAGSTDRSQLRCSFCKASGHTVKTCRKKNKPAQRTKKVDNVEDYEDEGSIDEAEEEVEEPEIECLSE